MFHSDPFNHAQKRRTQTALLGCIAALLLTGMFPTIVSAGGKITDELIRERSGRIPVYHPFGKRSVSESVILKEEDENTGTDDDDDAGGADNPGNAGTVFKANIVRTAATDEAQGIIAGIKDKYGVTVVQTDNAALSVEQLRIVDETLAQFGPGLLKGLKEIRVTPDGPGFGGRYDLDAEAVFIDADPNVSAYMFRATLTHELAHEVDFTYFGGKAFEKLYYQSGTAKDFAREYGMNTPTEDFATFLEAFVMDPTGMMNRALEQGMDSVFGQKLVAVMDIMSTGHPGSLTLTSADGKNSAKISLQRDAAGKISGINGVSLKDAAGLKKEVAAIEAKLYPGGKPPPPDTGGLVSSFCPSRLPPGAQNTRLIVNVTHDRARQHPGELAAVFGLPAAEAGRVQMKIDEKNPVIKGDYVQVTLRDSATGEERTAWINVPMQFVVHPDDAEVMDFSNDPEKQLVNKAHSIVRFKQDEVFKLLGITPEQAGTFMVKLDYANVKMDGTRLSIDVRFQGKDGSYRERTLQVDFVTGAIAL